MLVVDFDPNRPKDQGQYHVRLINMASGDFGNDARRQSQLGYWCDLGHLRSGILRPAEVAVEAAMMDQAMRTSPRERLRQALEANRLHTMSIAGDERRWDVADVMAILEDHDVFADGG